MSDLDPLLPRYGRDCLASLIPVLCAPGGPRRIPDWMPADVEGADKVMLLVLDGLGWNQLETHRDLIPSLAEFRGGPITTVAPSTTATALTSLTTGLAPSDHGLVGYRIAMGDTIMNVLRWGDESGDLSRAFPPETIQSCPPFLGSSVPVLSRAELEGTGFTRAHLSGVKPRGWRASSSIAVTAREAFANGETFVYAYYDGVDKIAHERGFGPYYEAELAHVDHLVSAIVDALPSDTVLIVTADHGQVHVGDRIVVHDSGIDNLVARQSGEGRFRWLHSVRGRERSLLDACRKYSEIAWVVTRDQVVDEGWFGPRTPDAIARRLGDVALVARAPVSFEDPAESFGPQLVCRHGSLTADEMLIPLLARVV
jgi:hypothetical protein